MVRCLPAPSIADDVNSGGTGGPAGKNHILVNGKLCCRTDQSFEYQKAIDATTVPNILVILVWLPLILVAVHPYVPV